MALLTSEPKSVVVKCVPEGVLVFPEFDRVIFHVSWISITEAHKKSFKIDAGDTNGILLFLLNLCLSTDMIFSLVVVVFDVSNDWVAKRTHIKKGTRALIPGLDILYIVMSHTVVVKCFIVTGYINLLFSYTTILG